MKFKNQIERVTYMQKICDEIWESLHSNGNVYEKLIYQKDKIDILEKYYLSQEWLEDFDEEREDYFPKTMNRAILTEDTIYDILDDVDQCLKRGK